MGESFRYKSCSRERKHFELTVPRLSEEIQEAKIYEGKINCKSTIDKIWNWEKELSLLKSLSIVELDYDICAVDSIENWANRK